MISRVQAAEIAVSATTGEQYQPSFYKEFSYQGKIPETLSFFGSQCGRMGAEKAARLIRRIPGLHGLLLCARHTSLVCAHAASPQSGFLLTPIALWRLEPGPTLVQTLHEQSSPLAYGAG